MGMISEIWNAAAGEMPPQVKSDIPIGEMSLVVKSTKDRLGLDYIRDSLADFDYLTPQGKISSENKAFHRPIQNSQRFWFC